MARDAEYWIEKLGMSGHPEGGYFRETYRAPEGIPATYLPGRYNGDRVFQTGIYFLLESGQKSALHRMESDEMWHFYTGSPLTVYCLHADGRREDIRLGPDPDQGEVFQATVPRGTWFGAEVAEPDSFALVGCTVAPGFEFDDFTLGSRADLLERFPQHAELVKRMTIEP